MQLGSYDFLSELYACVKFMQIGCGWGSLPC